MAKLRGNVGSARNRSPPFRLNYSSVLLRYPPFLNCRRASLSDIDFGAHCRNETRSLTPSVERGSVEFNLRATTSLYISDTRRVKSYTHLCLFFFSRPAVRSPPHYPDPSRRERDNRVQETHRRRHRRPRRVPKPKAQLRFFPLRFSRRVYERSIRPNERESTV